MSFKRKNFGKFGEDTAVSFLKKKGYKIIERNFRTRFGEIDIVCRKGDKIIFVEVRAKSGAGYGRPEESINLRKKQKLAAMAAIYLQTKKLHHCNFGIDGVFVDANGKQAAIRYLENIVEL